MQRPPHFHPEDYPPEDKARFRRGWLIFLALAAPLTLAYVWWLISMIAYLIGY